MSTLEKINKALELAFIASEQFKRAWREAADAIKEEVSSEFPNHSAEFQRWQVGLRLTAEGLPQNIGREWA